MKKIFPIFFFICSIGAIYSQFYQEEFVDRATYKKGVKKVETIVLEDTSGKAPYTSQIDLYHADGYKELGIYFEPDGDTIGKTYCSFPDSNTEVTIYNHVTQNTNILYEQYNDKGKLVRDVWIWGDDNNYDTTFYHYNKKGRLIQLEERYWRSRDLYKYKGDKLVLIRTKEAGNKAEEEAPENYISAKYIYAKDGRSVEKYEYNYSHKPSTVTKRTYNEKGLPILEETWKIDKKVKKLNWVHRYEYYENGELKTTIAQQFENNEVKWSVTHSYNEKGCVTETFIRNEIFKYNIRQTYHYSYY